MRKFGFGIALLAVLAFTSLAAAAEETANSASVLPPRLAAPVQPTAPVAGESRFYVCDKTFNPPKCARVNDPVQQIPVVEDVEDIDWATVLAANRAARTGAATPIIDPNNTGPIAGCGNSHGQSACCKIISHGTMPERSTIECGNL